jgi:hypothetical protein
VGTKKILNSITLFLFPKEEVIQQEIFNFSARRIIEKRVIQLVDDLQHLGGYYRLHLTAFGIDKVAPNPKYHTVLAFATHVLRR